MTAPRVSVIVPTYNQADFLAEAIASVRAQTITDWEMIVVNNQSTDHTLQVVERFADDRISVVELQNGGVIARARNRGLALARGPLIAFLDSDDCWYPEKLERCLKCMHDDVDLVCHAEVWTRNGQPIKDVHYGPEASAQFHSLLYKGNCISTSAVVARRDVVREAGGFSEDRSVITAEDYDLWLKLSRRGARFRFLPELLGEYRLHDASASGSSTPRHIDAITKVVERHHREIDDGSLGSRLRIRKRRAILYYGAARLLQTSGHRAQAWLWIGQAIASHPFLLRAYLGAIAGLLPVSHRRNR